MERRQTLVETQDALSKALEEWLAQPALGMDVESNSFFAYRERTCLLQVSSRDADWVVDPYAVDLAPMGPLFANAAIEKVLHASELDVVSLRRDYGFQIEGLYDTLVAAKAVGRRRVGLASLLEDLFQVTLDKNEQRSNWGRRPLTERQLRYAFADTRWLLPLADALKQEVAAKGVEEEVAVDSRRMAAREARPREVDPDAFERHPSARKMDPVSRQVLKALYLAREARGEQLDRPLFKIASDQLLGEIALRRPRSKGELARVPGCTPPIVHRHGEAFLRAIEEGLEAGPLPFRKKSNGTWDPNIDERYEKLRAWRKGVALERDVEVEVIANNAVLKALAKANPQSVEALSEVPELDEYRLRKYGPQLIAALST